VHRKTLFRDRNQKIKRRLFALERRPDALRGVLQPLNQSEFTLNALKLSNSDPLEPDNSDTFVSSPLLDQFFGIQFVRSAILGGDR
jgi:hypothetical protein